MNDFDIKKFLTENKMTRNSRLLNEGLFVDKKKMSQDISDDYKKIAQSIKNIEDSKGDYKKHDVRGEWTKAVTRMIDLFEKKWNNKLNDMGAIEGAKISAELRDKVKLLRDEIKKYDWTLKK